MQTEIDSPAVITAPAAARRWVALRSPSRRVAVVPTMGALHEGHLALVRRAHELADDVVVTIFVNPTQFAPHEDLSRYPRPIDDDLRMLRRERVAMVFMPSIEAIYPAGFSTFIEPPAVGVPLEGERRPGHFRGVCTVVLKLFQIVPAHVAIFGQKDFQQACVIQAMVRDLDLAITLDIMPTVREAGGLAMSSRNRYLTETERGRALSINQSLTAAANLYSSGQRQVRALEAVMHEKLAIGSPGGVDSIDYACVVNAETLLPIETVDDSAAALIAARVGNTRLIDNHVFSNLTR